MRFIDTNVLLYAISRDAAEQDKAKRASDLLADHDLALSVQVLQEFYVQATRASRPDPSPTSRRSGSLSHSAAFLSRTSPAQS